MATDQMNAGAEFQLGPTMVFRAGYIRNSLVRTIEDQGALRNGDEVYFYGNPGEGATAITPTSGATKPFPTPKPAVLEAYVVYVGFDPAGLNAPEKKKIQRKPHSSR